MDKENGKSSEGSSGSSKLSNPPDPTALLDPASLFAYWPRNDANSANAANLFATAGGTYGLTPHPAIPFGMLPPTPGRGVPSFPPTSSAAAAYNNAYTNTLSVAASQAASLGIPAASAAWWSMASHLAAQDYLARLQASGLNFPGLGNPADPYSSLGLTALGGSHHKTSKTPKSSASSSSSSSSLPKQQGSGNLSAKEKSTHNAQCNSGKSSSDNRHDLIVKTSSPMPNSKGSASSTTPKYSNVSGLTIQPSVSSTKLSSASGISNVTNSCGNEHKKSKSAGSSNDIGYMKNTIDKPRSTPPSTSIFTNPVSMASNVEKSPIVSNTSTTPPITSSSTVPSLPSSILSDPNSILGGVRLPPDTEIIKYTSSIVGPKIPGTTNRGRKKTISLDPPSVSLHPTLSSTGMLIERSTKRLKLAKRKRQEELEKQKHEEQQRKQQERELKRQQNAILKEQMYIQEISKQREMLYTVELERERRRQHMALVKALENRRKLEERERKKQQMLAEKQANKEKKLEQRRIEMEILTELRKPCEDLELAQQPLPEYERISGIKLPGKAFADVLMVFEFLHNFGETLGFDMESLPTLDSLQQALLYNDTTTEAEEELLSVMTHLIVCAIEDPGIPNPARHTTILGQSLRQADITHANISEILRIYLYANATGEVKALTGVHFERDREKRIADHHQNECEMQQTQTGKNATYYELLHENPTWKMSDLLKDKPFLSLSPTDKAAILAFICNELLQNKAVIRQIEGSLETVAHCKKEKWLLDAKIRKLRMLHSRKIRTEAAEKAHAKVDGECVETTIDSPAIHKDDLLDDEENEMSENESVGTQPEEEEDNKLSGEELGKKLEKLVKASEIQLQSLNASIHQLRATCFGQDRYWRRYWSLPKAGGIFIEGMESAQPEILNEQDNVYESNSELKTLEEIKKIIHDADGLNDHSADKEVSTIVGNDENVEEAEIKKEVEVDNNDNEHRKTTNRLIIVENGDIMDTREGNLDELRRSVDRIVQNLEGENKQNESQGESLRSNLDNHIDAHSIKPDPDTEQISNRKFNLFEKLGECMERENKTEEDLKAEVKAEVKEELKNEILNELKNDMKTEIKSENEEDKSELDKKWFSILPKDGLSCKGVHLTAGNRWDNGVGACTRDNLTELKIPVFPPPNSSSNYIASHCDSPAPLQMTAEESAQLEYIKKHGLPKSCERKIVPLDKRYGWWRVRSTEQLRDILDNLHVRGARERELKRTFVGVMQTMYEDQGRLHIEEGQKEATELISNENDEVEMVEGVEVPAENVPLSWSPMVAQRVDLFLLEQVEALEDKVANASMQVKGWRIPNRDLSDVPLGQVVGIAKERLASLEAAIERRYLKPPLGVRFVSECYTKIDIYAASIKY
ncbi:hypothetical protein Trydic_g5593 [Trypoxylus dichotomus]